MVTSIPGNQASSSEASRRVVARVSNSAVSVIELLFVVILGFLLLSLVYWLLSSTGRLLTRGQNKMFDTTQVEIVFRHLDEDLHALKQPPTISSTAPQLVLERHSSEDSFRVEWCFNASPDGTGSSIVRTIKGTSTATDRTSRFCLGSLSSHEITPVNTSPPALTMKIRCKTKFDAAPTQFGTTVFYQNQMAEDGWNPVAGL